MSAARAQNSWLGCALIARLKDAFSCSWVSLSVSWPPLTERWRRCRSGRHEPWHELRVGLLGQWEVGLCELLGAVTFQPQFSLCEPVHHYKCKA